MPPRGHAYSFSAVETFHKCPLKYKLKYLDGVHTGIETIEAFMGNRVHEALQWLYENLADGNEGPSPGLEDLGDFYDECWEGEWHAKIRVVRGKPQDYFEIGLVCIQNFYMANRPFRQSRTIATEDWIECEIDLGWSGRRLFRGKVDRIASRPDGIYEIHDYKTGKWPYRDELPWPQMAIYQWVLQSMQPEFKSVELFLHYLRDDRVLCRRLEECDLVPIVADMKSSIIRIEGESEFHPNRTPLCDWCEFRDGCPAF